MALSTEDRTEVLQLINSAVAGRKVTELDAATALNDADTFYVIEAATGQSKKVSKAVLATILAGTGVYWATLEQSSTESQQLKPYIDSLPQTTANIFTIADGSAGTKEIIFDVGASGGNPRFRWNGNNLQFADDGVSFTNFGAVNLAGSTLSGLPAGTATPIQASDLLLQALANLQAQISGISAPGAKNSVTYDSGEIQLLNDIAAPGNNQVYGTDATGQRVWKPDPVGGGSLTASEIKTLYESNLDTNEFNDAEKLEVGTIDERINSPVQAVVNSGTLNIVGTTNQEIYTQHIAMSAGASDITTVNRTGDNLKVLILSFQNNGTATRLVTFPSGGNDYAFDESNNKSNTIVLPPGERITVWGHRNETDLFRCSITARNLVVELGHSTALRLDRPFNMTGHVQAGALAFNVDLANAIPGIKGESTIVYNGDGSPVTFSVTNSDGNYQGEFDAGMTARTAISNTGLTRITLQFIKGPSMNYLLISSSTDTATVPSQVATQTNLSGTSIAESNTVNQVIATITSDANPLATGFNLAGADAAHFNVFDNGGTFQLRATTVFDFESPVDTGSDNGYDITLAAVNSEGTQAAPTAFTINVTDAAEAQLSQPQNLVVTPVSNTELSASVDAVIGAQDYLFEWDTSNTFPSPQSAVTTLPSITLNNLLESTQYFVRVTAQHPTTTNSIPSSVVSATTLAGVFSTFSPSSGSTDIAINSAIIITLSQQGATGSGIITDTNIDNFIELEETISTTPIAFDATINAGETQATITPAANLPGNTQITARLLTGLQTTIGAIPFPANSANFTTSNAVDNTPPLFVNAEVGSLAENCVTLNFDENLNPSVVSPLTALTIQIDSVNATMKHIRIQGVCIKAYIQENIQPGQVITAAYTQPVTDRIQDLNGNELATFGAQTVANNTVAFAYGDTAVRWHKLKNEYSDYEASSPANRVILVRDRKGLYDLVGDAVSGPHLDNELVSNHKVARGYETGNEASNNLYTLIESQSTGPYSEWIKMHDGTDFSYMAVGHIPSFSSTRTLISNDNGGITDAGIQIRFNTNQNVSFIVFNPGVPRPLLQTFNLAAALSPGVVTIHIRYNSGTGTYSYGVNNESFTQPVDGGATFGTTSNDRMQLISAATGAHSFGEELLYHTHLSQAVFDAEYLALRNDWGL